MKNWAKHITQTYFYQDLIKIGTLKGNVLNVMDLNVFVLPLVSLNDIHQYNNYIH